MDQRTANAALVTVPSAAVTELIRAQPDGIAVFSEVHRRVLQEPRKISSPPSNSRSINLKTMCGDKQDTMSTALREPPLFTTNGATN